ncbi:MAG: hypothetical protein K2K63_00650 [Acetatifactor sp.]|nr:hypothetical protein [Acetatifactor sp.]
MGKRGKAKQRICFVALLLVLSLAGTGCEDCRQAEKLEHTTQTEKTVSKAGSLSYGYFLGEEGIVISSGERFLYSDWEPVEFDYICMDPTCSHLSESCSARTIQDEASALGDFCVAYQDRLIIFHAYFQYVSNDTSKEVWDTSTVYQTDVYEADPDGSNRRKMATFSGMIGNPLVPHAIALVEGKLYFGGPTEVRNKIEQDIPSGEQEITTLVSAAVYCLNLNDYTIETFMVMENKEGAPVYKYQIYEFDGMIYWIINYAQDDDAILYRSDPGTGACEEILRFDSCAVMFDGVIGNTVYYWYENSGKTLYARDISAGATEREIMTVTEEVMFASAYILDGQLLIMTDRCMEEENRMAEYTMLDPEGKILDTIRYDDYITFLDVVGDKIIYFRGYPEWEVWWADRADLTDLPEKGVRIGPLYGWRLDTLKE